jgi:hypothetical protein
MRDADSASFSELELATMCAKHAGERILVPRQRRDGAMSKPPYRALRVVLGFLSLLLAIGGVIMIVSNKPLIMRMFMHPPESEISTLLLAALKEMGGMVLMVSVMLFFASRDPERNVAIIDALIVGLCILALTPLVSLYTLDLRSLYPAYLIWVRALVRLALASVLYYLRPRDSHWQPAGHF